MASVNGSVRSKPYRGHNFPYHFGPPPTPSGFNLKDSRQMSRGITPGSSSQRPSTSSASAVPTSYMVLNFRSQFIDEAVVENLNKDIRIEEKRLKQLQQEYNERRAGSAPRLNSSFLLPRKPNPKAEPVRNMIGRADVATQADSNMNKLNFAGLNQYQKWSADEVEPFFKELKKVVKAQRPEDMHSYIIAYCQAVASGEPIPETVSV